ncbi:hypothetical protein PILCRDRAFT_823877 [Piloderma croceum F 1598]|uniref:YCII-related domain-containing protein n=1 Tax=Piloderma croceum (strain F 1598) TaxID=765440 RepID=A0A0C3FGA1_PILCF|nr:hypothetical protein PILCRDRAFT_823877 [Piloderma croceum F 1598]
MTSKETADIPTLHNFILYAPDRTEEGTFEKRLTVRSKHLENISALIGKGVVKVGGVMLTPESIEAATSSPKMTGSVLILQAENIDIVKKIAETDIYYTTGVWDPQMLVIAPFILATPLP